MPLVILYGTQSGTAEEVAFRVARLALSRKIESVRCMPADSVPVEEWYDLAHGNNNEPSSSLLFIVSNINQGDAPETFRKSWFRLLSETEASLQLRCLRYAVFGLGDSIYTKFNYMAKMLHNRLEKLRCQPLLFRGLGDESDAKGIDEVLLPWLMKLWVALRCVIAPSQDSENPLASSIFPLYKISQLFPDKLVGDENNKYNPNLVPSANTFSYSSLPISLEPTFTCEVTANQRITATEHFQTVHHLELKPLLSVGRTVVDFHSNKALTYEVGDALGIYCPNRPVIVQEMLQFLKLSGEEILLITPDDSHGLVQQTDRPFFQRSITSRHFLTYCVDLEAVVKHEFFWMLSFFVKARKKVTTSQASQAWPDIEKTQDADHEWADEEDNEAMKLIKEVTERLLELANPLEVDGYLEYAHREKRNVCEVLHDFNMANSKTFVQPPLEYTFSFLSPMRSRYFSLSSSLAMDGPEKLCLTVAQLAWQTPMKRQRTGLCSTYLVTAEVGSKITCALWQGTLTFSGLAHPLLCIATGTGIAPIRSLIRHCASSKDSSWINTPIFLFFGCRSASKDFLYSKEWNELQELGKLRQLHVIPAFSRDTEKKIYVQHQLGRYAKRVNKLLLEEQAIIYLCGNAKQMPKDVHLTLQHIVATCGCNGDESEASQKMKQIAKLGRYQIDTWSA